MTRYEQIKEAVKADDAKEIARMLCDACGECSECFARVGYGCHQGNNAFLKWLNDEGGEHGTDRRNEGDY